MKTISLLSFISLAIFSSSFAQIKITNVQPELYYANGNYSTNTISDGFYGNVNLVINNFDLVRVGFTKIYFDNPDWEYDQTNYSIGGVKNLYPFYIKTSFLYMKGNFDYKPFFSKYLDKLYTFAFEIDYSVNLFYLAINFAYTDFTTSSTSLVSLNSKQLGLPFTYEPSNDFFISVTPTFTFLTDRESMFSTEVLLKYSPTKNITTYLSGFIGKRAYFYNHNLYTIYNQNSTQLNGANFLAEYKIFNKLSIAAGYTYTEFEDYSINYYIAGLKINL
jgi:hypothetical protein